MPAHDAAAGDQPLPRGMAAGTCFPRDLPGAVRPPSAGTVPRLLWASGKGLCGWMDGMERRQLGAANPLYPACAALLSTLWLSLVLLTAVTAWIRAFEVTVAQSPRSVLFQGRQAGLVPRHGEACAMAECRGCRGRG